MDTVKNQFSCREPFVSARSAFFLSLRDWTSLKLESSLVLLQLLHLSLEGSDGVGHFLLLPLETHVHTCLVSLCQRKLNRES